MNLQFKDNAKHQNINHAMIIVELAPIQMNGVRRRVVEFRNLNGSNWHMNTPLEREYKEAEQHKDQSFLSMWGKYRKDQKRKDYSEDEFQGLFEPIKCKTPVDEIPKK